MAMWNTDEEIDELLAERARSISSNPDDQVKAAQGVPVARFTGMGDVKQAEQDVHAEREVLSRLQQPGNDLSLGLSLHPKIPPRAAPAASRPSMAPKALDLQPRGLGEGFAADASGGLKALGEMAKGAAPAPDDGSSAVRLQRLFEDAELAKAQKADARNAKDLQFARLLEGATAKILNRKADLSAYEGDGTSKAKDLMAQLGVAQGRRKEDADAAHRTAEAKRLADLLGFNKSRAEADDTFRKDEAKRKGGEFDRNLEWEQEKARLDRQNAIYLAGLKAKGEGAGKMLTAAEAGELGALESVLGSVDDLYGFFEDKTGPFSGAMQYVPRTDASKYKDRQDLAAQTIGKALEGGKLTKEDYEKYQSLLPSAGDSKERAEAKRDGMKQLINQVRAGRLKGFRQAGYNTSGFSDAVPGSSPAKSSGAGSPDFSAAEKWLAQNPDHPKAAEVRARIGRK